MNVHVYALIDPIKLKIRYIGITQRTLKYRLTQHISEPLKKGLKTHKCNWVHSLLKKGHTPIIKSLCVKQTRQEALKLEKTLIEKYKKKHYLTNDITEGKFTSKGYKSADTLKSKKVYAYTYEGNYHSSYSSIKECSKILNIYNSTVKKCLHGKYKFAKNYQFSFIKHDKMTDLTSYSKGSSKEVVLKDNLTNNLLKFKSGSDCKEKLQLDCKETSIDKILGSLNKKYGDKYSMLINGKYKQSFYYNTGIIIHTDIDTYKFTSKKDLLNYMGYKAKSVVDKVLTKYINSYFKNILKIEFNKPLCEVIHIENHIN